VIYAFAGFQIPGETFLFYGWRNISFLRTIKIDLECKFFNENSENEAGIIR